MSGSTARIMLRGIALIVGIIGAAVVMVTVAMVIDPFVQWLMDSSQRWPMLEMVFVVVPFGLVLGGWMLIVAWQAWREPSVEHARVVTMPLVVAVWLSVVPAVEMLLPGDMGNTAEPSDWTELAMVASLVVIMLVRALWHLRVDRALSDGKSKPPPVISRLAAQFITLVVLVAGMKLAFMFSPTMDEGRVGGVTMGIALVTIGVTSGVYLVLMRPWRVERKC